MEADGELIRHSGQGDGGRTPAKVDDVEDSQIANDEEEEEVNSETFNFAERLGDLSCSLLDCDGGQHGDGTLEESIVENLVTALGKRDDTIAKLNNYLSTFLTQKGDGDCILNSVEKNLENLANGLKNSNFLTNSKPTAITKAVENNVASTQTDDISFDFDELGTTPKSIRDCGTSISPLTRDNVNSYEDGSPLRFDEGTPGEPDQRLSTSFVNSHQDQESDTEEETNENEASSSQPKRRLSFAMNPDSLRLTFSPSICEYEAESHCAPHDTSGPAIEDLRLQVIDIERKLEAEKRFLTEMTLEREQEREEFQRTINTLSAKYQDLRREKEKLENTVEHQQLEISELEDHFREKELVEDQLINKDCQLQQAVEKVFELREIIRSQEELIESMTKQSKALLDSKREVSEALEADSDLSEPCNDICRKDTSCMSDIDHAEELQAQVDELAKKIEEKLLELENFSWQNRPNSSCSATGDDVSVRGTSTRIPNCDESADARDFVSRVFCGLRRLESSFDGLVRFEEVLLKKMKDAELKVGIDNKKLDELKAENGKLTSDLTTCLQKIKDFEAFLKDNKRRDHHDSFSNHSIERLRNMGGMSFGKPFESGSSPLRHHHNMKRDVDQSFPISTTEEMQQFEEEASVPIFSSSPAVVPEEPKQLSSASPVVSEEPTKLAATSPVAVPEEPKKFAATSATSPVAVSEEPKQLAATSRTSPVAISEEPKQLAATSPAVAPEEHKQLIAEKSKLQEDALSNPKVTEPLAAPSRQASLESKTLVPEQTDLQKDPSVKNLPSQVELPRAYSSHEVISESTRVSQDEGLGESITQTPVTSAENTAEPKPISTETVEITTVSDFEVAGDQVTYLGTEVVPEESINLEDGIPQDGIPPKESESEVLTIENTVVTDVVLEDVDHVGESIIPPVDLNSPVENNDSQTSRLEGLDAILELEKIKTQLSQTQRALEAEKEKSQILEKTVNEIGTQPYQQQPTGDVSSGRDPAVEQEISQLVDDLKCKNQKYTRHMICAIARIQRLQEENEDLRRQIVSLQSGFLENGDQDTYYPDEQM